MKGSKFQQRASQNPISTYILTKMDTVCSQGNFLTPSSHLTTHHRQIDIQDRDTRTHTLEQCAEDVRMQHQGCAIPTKGFFLARRTCGLRTQAGQLRAPESLDDQSQDLPSAKVD